MIQTIKEFSGYSDSKIFLLQKDKTFFIRKIGNINRNFEQLEKLNNLNFNVPKIFNKKENSLDMEYLHGINMEEFLKIYDFKLLLKFLLDCFEKMLIETVTKDYTDIYNKKLNNIDFSRLEFSKEDLISKLPKYLPSSIYHGDLTLENIIYSNNQFYFIDCVTIEYDSFVFDIAKLRQDLECKWFLRKTSNIGLDSYLNILQHKILEKYPIAANNYLLILMLLRVYPYALERQDNFTIQFIETNIQKLWK